MPRKHRPTPPQTDAELEAQFGAGREMTPEERAADDSLNHPEEVTALQLLPTVALLWLHSTKTDAPLNDYQKAARRALAMLSKTEEAIAADCAFRQAHPDEHPEPE